MPLNEGKIISIILKNAENVPDRCEGYRDEIIDVISEILGHERQHRVQGTNIQQKISEVCLEAGRFLAEAREEDDSAGDGK